MCVNSWLLKRELAYMCLLKVLEMGTSFIGVNSYGT